VDPENKAETALRNLLRKKADVMTDILHRLVSQGERQPEAAGLVVFPLANCPSSRSIPPEVADQEEVLVADVRFHLTPSQMVDHKLAVLLLGAGCLATRARVALGQHVRRMAGSREGTGPAHYSDVTVRG
jgi:hypothetical protein